MGTKLLNRYPIELESIDFYGVFNDFAGHYTTAEDFTTTASNSGTVAVSDGARGTCTITTSDTSLADNDETYLHGTTEAFKFATDKPMIFQARLATTAANTACFLANNLIVGVKDAVAADSIQDDGAGPAASYSGAVFFKADGANYWNCESSVSTSQTTVTLTDHAIVNATYQVLRIETNPVSSTQTEVHFYIGEDSDTLEEVGLTTSGKQFVCQKVTHTSATEMEVCVGIKAGAANAANTAPTIRLDYVGCWQKR